MRVIAGKAKGQRLKGPGVPTTRPATGMIRGVIFSILEGITQDWSRVLDLFSGTGALGIEALSRGADWVDFVEHNPKCCSIIKQNLEKTKLSGQAHVYCWDASRAIARLDKEYNIILIDPPYADESIGSLITRLADSKLVGADTTVVVTHSSRFPLSPTYSTLEMFKERCHGDSCISFYRKEARP